MLSFGVHAQSLPSFMKDIRIRTSLIKPSSDPTKKLVFSGKYIYKTDTNFNTLSNKYFSVPGNSASWGGYIENDSVSAVLLDYSYVTPSESTIGNVICLINRNTDDTIRTIRQSDLRSYYIDFYKDTLILFNKSVRNDNSYNLKKISKTGQVLSSTNTPYTANSIGRFRFFKHGNSIYLYSLSQFDSSTTTINVKRLDLSGNLIQSNIFNVSFPKKNGYIELSTIITEQNSHVILLRRSDNSVTAPLDYYLFASDTLGNKLWENSIDGKYSSRSNVALSKNSDSTYLTYGCKTKDSIWSYFIQKRNLFTGQLIDSVVGKLVHKTKELTSICNSSVLINNSSGFDLLISYRNVTDKYSQYPISLITKFSFDNQLNEMDRHTIRLNGYWLYGIFNVMYDNQNRITFMGEHSPSIAVGNKTYITTYEFKSDYEHTYYTVGIDQFNSNNFLGLYPNPAYNKLSIQSSFKVEKYCIYNLLGEKQLEGNYADEIDVSTLSSGMYVIQIKNDTGYTNHKFIKE